MSTVLVVDCGPLFEKIGASSFVVMVRWAVPWKSASGANFRPFRAPLDIGGPTGKGHRRIVRAVALEEIQPTCAVERQRAVIDRQRDFYRSIVVRIRIGDADSVPVVRRENKVRVQAGSLCRVRHVVDRRRVSFCSTPLHRN